ncbi:MAG: hypothetical protein R3E39_30160 [Anaerolineae bacterium]
MRASRICGAGISQAQVLYSGIDLSPVGTWSARIVTGWSAWLQIKFRLKFISTPTTEAFIWRWCSPDCWLICIRVLPGRSLAWPRSITPIFWMMILRRIRAGTGAVVPVRSVSVPGLILHLSATIWLLLNVIKPLVGDRQLRTPGMLHLITAYAWILAPVLVYATYIILQVPGFPARASNKVRRRL